MNSTDSVNAKSESDESQGFFAPAPAEKPHVERYVLSNGAVRLYGVSAAARWLGVGIQALSAVARGKNVIPVGWEGRAREEFPALFGDVQN